jgi:hypothetical protein
LLAYCNDVMGLGLTFEKFTALAGAPLVDALQVATPFTGGAGNAPLREDPLRFYFDKAGVLACRPAPQTDCQLGVAIKSDGNGSHSHNDVGSYAIAIGDDEPTGDPGGPKTYDNKTFGPERYTYKILNSYGHPVPVIAGKLQIDATKAKPVVLSTAFTKDRDEIKIDMAPAYNVPALKQLTRTMDYSRAGTGEVDMIDDVSYSSPSTFEDALITHGDWKQVDPKTVLLTLGQAKLWLTIEAPGGFTLKPEKIEELATPAFTRLGVVLSQPVQTARVRMVFHPAP